MIAEGEADTALPHSSSLVGQAECDEATAAGAEQLVESRSFGSAPRLHLHEAFD